MTRDEMRKIERDLSDENILLKSQNARLRADLSRATQAWREAKQNETRLRAELIISARAFHSIACEDVPMSMCPNQSCQVAVKEM